MKLEIGLALLGGEIATSVITATSRGALPLVLFGAGALTGTALPTFSLVSGLSKKMELEDTEREILQKLEKKGIDRYDHMSELKEVNTLIQEAFRTKPETPSHE